MITVKNHGPLVVESNYWTSEAAQRGKLFCSVNAGAIRILLPGALNAMLVVKGMRTGKHCILSRGPWPEQNLPEAVEILFDDGTDSPFALHLSPESFDMLPGEPEPNREWTAAVYVEKDGAAHRALERKCYWRRVDRLPCLKPWKEDR